MFYIYFEVESLPKLQNARSKTSFWNYHREAKNWVTWVGLATIGKRPEKPLKRALVIITRCSSQEPDCDGLYSGMKAPLDALVKMGIIEDDRPSMIEFIAKWEKAPLKKGKIKFQIKEIVPEE